MHKVDDTKEVLRRSAQKDALRRAAEVLGGQSAMATLLGYTDRRAVWPWFNTERDFPADFCPTVEQATRDLGKPVMCEELRSDVKWDVVRNAPIHTPRRKPAKAG